MARIICRNLRPKGLLPHAAKAEHPALRIRKARAEDLSLLYSRNTQGRIHRTLEFTKVTLAACFGISRSQIIDGARGHRQILPDTGLRLSRVFRASLELLAWPSTTLKPWGRSPTPGRSESDTPNNPITAQVAASAALANFRKDRGSQFSCGAFDKSMDCDRFYPEPAYRWQINCEHYTSQRADGISRQSKTRRF